MSDLQQKVAQKYGAFGARPDDEEIDRKVLADNFFKPTMQLIAGIFAATLFASFASSPKFSAPGAWANSFRLDTALVVVWGPLLYWVMARQRVWKSLRIYLVLALFIEPFSEAMFKDMGADDEIEGLVREGQATGIGHHHRAIVQDRLPVALQPVRQELVAQDVRAQIRARATTDVKNQVGRSNGEVPMQPGRILHCVDNP